MPVNILDPWMLVLSAGIYKRAFPRERLCKSWAEELLGFSFCIFFFSSISVLWKVWSLAVYRVLQLLNVLKLLNLFPLWFSGVLLYMCTLVILRECLWGKILKCLLPKKKKSASSLYCRSSLTDSPVPEKTKMDFLSCSAFSILRKFVSWEPCFNGVLGVLG